MNTPVTCADLLRLEQQLKDNLTALPDHLKRQASDALTMNRYIVSDLNQWEVNPQLPVELLCIRAAATATREQFETQILPAWTRAHQR